MRGKIPAPVMGMQSPSLIEASVEKHSAKPEIFLKFIEQYFPNMPKIELNPRGRVRSGWDSWSNEAEPSPPKKDCDNDCEAPLVRTVAMDDVGRADDGDRGDALAVRAGSSESNGLDDADANRTPQSGPEETTASGWSRTI